MGLLLAALAFGLLAAAAVRWMGLIQRVEIDEGRSGLHRLLAASAGAALLAFLVGVGTLGGVLAGVALLGGALYAGLLSLAGQSQQAPAMAVGQPLPDFTAPDENGEPFSSASLRGHPVLIKVFRGHW